MTYDITLYFGTGFDTVNLPSSPSLLEQVARSTKTYSTNYLVQNTDFTSVRVADTFDNVKNADYCRIGSDRYYAVTGISMLNDNCAELGLSMDYLLSMGGIYSNNFRYFGATATRITPQNPSTDYNYLEEPFNPSMPMDQSTIAADLPGEATPFLDNNTATIIGTTVDIPQLTKVNAVAFETEDGDEVGYFPELPQISQGTQISVNMGEGARSYRLPNELCFLIVGDNENNRKVLTTVQSMGVSDSIIDRYSLPGRWGSYAVDLEARITQITGRYASQNIARASVQGYTPVNAKTAELYAQLTIMSQLSGDNHTYPFGEIRTPGQAYATLRTFSDPSPKGKPYCGPAYYLGALQAGVMSAVQGAPWYSPQLVMQGAAGSAVTRYNLQREKADIRRGLQQNYADYVNAQTRAGVSLATAAASTAASEMTLGLFGEKNYQGIANAGMSLIENETARAHYEANARDKANDLATAANLSQSLYTPTIKTADGNNLSLVIPNTFRVIGQNLAASDAAALDRYLTKFGYAVPGEQITATDLNRGRYFCYVQCGEIQFGDAPSIPRYIRNGAIAQLLGGVRIWKRKPDVSLYSQSNQPV